MSWSSSLLKNKIIILDQCYIDVQVKFLLPDGMILSDFFTCQSGHVSVALSKILIFKMIIFLEYKLLAISL